MDTAVLVISLVLGFALVLMFIYRLGIEERFDRAAICCLVGGLILLAMASLGRFNLFGAEKSQAQNPVPGGSAVLVSRLDAQVSTAMSTAARALTVAAEAKEHAALKPSIQKIDEKLSTLKAEVAARNNPVPKTVSQPRKRTVRKSAWTRRMEARIRDLENQVKALKKANPSHSG